MDWGDAEGGFINDSTFAEPQAVVNSVSVGGDEKNKAVAAVTVSHIAKLTRPSEGLVLHGKKIYHVNLVAFVHEVLDVNPQKIHVLVDDFTSGGPLEVTHIIGDAGTPGDDPSLSMFSESNQQENRERSLSEIRVGNYIRCIGVVKANQDKSILVAYNMRFLEDINEITMHCLEVVRDNMYYADLQSGVTSNPAAATDNNLSSTTHQVNDGFGKLSTREKHLLKYLKEKCTSDDGIHIQEIVDNFKAFTRSDIEQSLNTLSAEGFCWQGDTEEYWCVNRGDM